MAYAATDLFDSTMVELPLSLLGLAAIVADTCYVNGKVRTAQQDFVDLLVAHESTFQEQYQIRMEYCLEPTAGFFTNARQFLYFYDTTEAALAEGATDGIV